MKSLEPLSDALASALPSSGSTPIALVAIARRWPQAVGELVAREAWPSRLSKDGTLLVMCSSAVWASELSHLAPTLRDSLERAGIAPAPLLRFVVGPVPRRPGRPKRRAPAVPTPAEEAQARAWAEAVRDPALRVSVARSVASVLAARRVAEIAAAARRATRSERDPTDRHGRPSC